MKVITLTTDFGVQDWFVGAMKGVILSVHPKVQIIDIGHGIPSGDIRAGALALMASFHYFPKGAIHVAVVDPGVGSSRAAVAIRSSDYVFLGPDNGLLSFALSDDPALQAYRIENEELFNKPVSNTFHGRDIFAPVAAHLAKGMPIEEVGPPMDQLEQLLIASPMVEPGKISGEIFYMDRFGNAFTNITVAHIGDTPPELVRIHIGKRKPIHLGSHYQEARPGHALGIIGSSGFLEIAINGKSAAEQLELRVGTKVIVRAA